MWRKSCAKWTAITLSDRHHRESEEAAASDKAICEQRRSATGSYQYHAPVLGRERGYATGLQRRPRSLQEAQSRQVSKKIKSSSPPPYIRRAKLQTSESKIHYGASFPPETAYRFSSQSWKIAPKFPQASILCRARIRLFFCLSYDSVETRSWWINYLLVSHFCPKFIAYFNSPLSSRKIHESLEWAMATRFHRLISEKYCAT